MLKAIKIFFRDLVKKLPVISALLIVNIGHNLFTSTDGTWDRAIVIFVFQLIALFVNYMDDKMFGGK